MEKPTKKEKYLVVNTEELQKIIDYDKNGSNCGVVVLRMEHSSKKHSGQLCWTKEFADWHKLFTTA